MPRLAPALALLLAALASGAGCHSRGAAAGADSGEVSLTLSLDASALPAGAFEAWVHLQGTTAQGDPWEGWFRAGAGAAGYTADLAAVPAGSYLVGARLLAIPVVDPALDAPALVTPADVAVTVSAGGGQHVALLLQAGARKGTKPPNTAPTVYAIVAIPALVDSADPTAVVTLSASATDPDVGDKLTYAWTAVDAITTTSSLGSFKNKSAQTTRWTPPSNYAGTVLFTATAIDLAGATGSLSTTVKAAPLSGSGTVAVSAGVNRAPDVSSIDVTDAQLAPLEVTTLAALASDADGDALFFAWSDGGCGGAFDVQGVSSTTWHAPAAPGPCTITLTVTDRDRLTGVPRGGATTSTVALRVDSTAGHSPPQFVLATQTPSGPSSGPFSFRVAAVEATAVPTVTLPVTAIAWSDGTGRAGAFVPQVPGGWDAVTWTPPACPAGAPPLLALSVTATATGTTFAPAAPLQSTFSFPVQIPCP